MMDLSNTTVHQQDFISPIEAMEYASSIVLHCRAIHYLEMGDGKYRIIAMVDIPLPKGNDE